MLKYLTALPLVMLLGCSPAEEPCSPIPIPREVGFTHQAQINTPEGAVSVDYSVQNVNGDECRPSIQLMYKFQGPGWLAKLREGGRRVLSFSDGRRPFDTMYSHNFLWVDDHSPVDNDGIKRIRSLTEVLTITAKMDQLVRTFYVQEQLSEKIAEYAARK